MKTTIILLLGTLSLFLSGCTHPNIGKPVDHYLPFNSSGTGYERVDFSDGDYILAYSYSINKEEKLITFTGTFNCGATAHNWNFSNGQLTISYISKIGTVAAIRQILSWSYEELCTEKFIDTSHPFQEDFDGLTFFLNLEMSE